MLKLKTFQAPLALMLVLTLVGCNTSAPPLEATAPTRANYATVLSVKPAVSEQTISAEAPTPAEGGAIVNFLKAPAKGPAPSAASAQKENAGTIFEGYTVTVTDSKTPAKMALGTDWPITTLYFMADNGEHLGSISGTAYKAIMEKYKVFGSSGLWNAPGSNGNWEFWFAEKFNDYRGISNGSSSETKNHQEGSDNNTSDDSPKKNVDTAEAALEVILLTNEERENAGVGTLDIDESLMELAQTRAEEVSTQYSHERPDGTRVVELGYGENVGAKASSSKQVNSWMNSEGHSFNILRERYKSIGVGCYQTAEGKLYWVQIFA